MFGKLQPVEQVMFIGLFSIADDEGRLMADPAYLRAEVFPYKDYTNKRVAAIRDAVVEKAANIHLYRVGAVDYIALLKWADYQRPKYPKPSKIPPPFPQGSPNVSPESEPVDKTSSRRVGQGRAGMDRDGQGRSDESPEPLSPQAVVEGQFGLPMTIEKRQELKKILGLVKGVDSKSWEVLEEAARPVTFAGVCRVRESVERKRPRPGVGYAVQALRSEAEAA